MRLGGCRFVTLVLAPYCGTSSMDMLCAFVMRATHPFIAFTCPIAFPGHNAGMACEPKSCLNFAAEMQRKRSALFQRTSRLLPGASQSTQHGEGRTGNPHPPLRDATSAQGRAAPHWPPGYRSVGGGVLSRRGDLQHLANRLRALPGLERRLATASTPMAAKGRVRRKRDAPRSLPGRASLATPANARATMLPVNTSFTAKATRPSGVLMSGRTPEPSAMAKTVTRMPAAKAVPRIRD